jgi:hypothetical protein
LKATGAILAVIGAAAGPSAIFGGDGSGHVYPKKNVTVLEVRLRWIVIDRVRWWLLWRVGCLWL